MQILKNEGDGCITVEWIERTEADDDAERLEFEIRPRSRMCWLNTQEVRGILDFEKDLEVVSTDQALAARDPIQWVQAEKPSKGMCTKCGDEGRKQWYTGIERCDVMPWGLKTLNLS